MRSAVVLSASGVLLGVVRPLGAGEAEAHVATPLVHPSWSPLLPIAMIVGLIIGLLACIVVRRVGLRITAGGRE